MHQFGGESYVPGWQRRFCIATCFIAIGLFEKVVIADGIAHLLDPLYRAGAGRAACSNGEAWLAFCFSFQILFDFSGYSDIAIGLGLLFGVQLPYNFNAPLRSTNIQDFWQRWHITLMQFLRDYCVSIRWSIMRVLPRRSLPAAVLRRHAAHHGAVRPVARRKLDLCALGRPPWPSPLVGCALWRRYGPRSSDGVRLAGP